MSLSRFVPRGGPRPQDRSSHPSQLRGVKASAGVTRKDFTDRLGLAEDASDAEVLIAVDRTVARRDERRAANPSPAEALSFQDAALYVAMWG